MVTPWDGDGDVGKCAPRLMLGKPGFSTYCHRSVLFRMFPVSLPPSERVRGKSDYQLSSGRDLGSEDSPREPWIKEKV